MKMRLREWILTDMVVALALVSASAAQSPVKEAGAGQVGMAPIGATQGILPSGMGEAVDHDVMVIREATEKFKNTEAAEAAGYKPDGGCMEYQPHGAMGYHYKNDDLYNDAKLDLEHPSVLVYEKMPDGHFQLNGVEFLVSIAGWKSSEPPRIMGQTLKKVDKYGFYYLHVWTWKASPTGLFADWNPDVKCVGGSGMGH
jgi:hypothetical protein